MANTFNPQSVQQPFEAPLSSFGSAHAPSHQGRKRKSSTPYNDLAQESTILPVDKRIRVTAPTIQPIAAICGVGPMERLSAGIPSKSSLSSSPYQPLILSHSPHPSASDMSLQSPPAPSSYASLRQNRRPTTGTAIATDVWYFCRAETTDSKSATPLGPEANDVILTKKPRSPFVSCKLCK